jgi:hypothetical protein
MLIPGIGPIIASGIIGALLFGAGGAAVGATLEESLVAGMPHDDVFVYEDALRRGHSVVIALVEDDELAERARAGLDSAGAERIDAARENWWTRPAQRREERYEGGAEAFARDELVFRSRLRGRDDAGGPRAHLGGGPPGPSRPHADVVDYVPARFRRYGLSS